MTSQSLVLTPPRTLVSPAHLGRGTTIIIAPAPQCPSPSAPGSLLFCSLLATRGRARRWAAGILVAEHCWRGRISCPQCASLDHHFQVLALRVYRTPVSNSRACKESSEAALNPARLTVDCCCCSPVASRRPVPCPSLRSLPFALPCPCLPIAFRSFSGFSART